VVDQSAALLPLKISPDARIETLTPPHSVHHLTHTCEGPDAALSRALRALWVEGREHTGGGQNFLTANLSELSDRDGMATCLLIPSDRRPVPKRPRRQSDSRRADRGRQLRGNLDRVCVAARHIRHMATLSD
jgi:hypothetical protein